MIGLRVIFPHAPHELIPDLIFFQRLWAGLTRGRSHGAAFAASTTSVGHEREGSLRLILARDSL
jgi:hypothetical protein